MPGSRTLHTNYRAFSSLLDHVLQVISQEEGYTLIELLVAMALLTLVLVGVYSILVSPVQSLETTLGSIGETQALIGAFRQMSLDLSSVIQPSLVYNVSFSGSRDNLSFSRHESNESIGILRYAIRPSLNEAAVLVLERQVRGMKTLEQDETAYILLSDEALSFEFWDSHRQIWVSTWNSNYQNGLPTIVRVRLSSGVLSLPIYPGRVFVGGRHEF